MSRKKYVQLNKKKKTKVKTKQSTMPQPQEIKRKKKKEKKEKKKRQHREEANAQQRKRVKKKKKKEKQCSEAHLQFVHGHFCHLAIRFLLPSFLLILERKLFGGLREKTLEPHLVIDIFVENLKKKKHKYPFELQVKSNQILFQFEVFNPLEKLSNQSSIIMLDFGQLNGWNMLSHVMHDSILITKLS